GKLKTENRYSPEDMHASLEDLAINRELTFKKILSVKAIKGWIGRYSANFKKEALEKALLENNNKHNEIFERTSSRHQRSG
ncbi:30291_t:CDS:1, partial [Gigaspora margarita]